MTATATAALTTLLAEAETEHKYNPYLFGVVTFVAFLVLLAITFALRRDR